MKICMGACYIHGISRMEYMGQASANQITCGFLFFRRCFAPTNSPYIFICFPPYREFDEDVVMRYN